MQYKGQVPENKDVHHKGFTTCSYKKKTAVENVLAAQPTIERLDSGSKYIKTHSAITNVGRLMMSSE